jgi:hypothetical protein
VFLPEIIRSSRPQERCQPRYNGIRRLLDSILREMTPIQQPAHLIEAGRRLYTDVVESVPALKSCQSTLLIPPPERLESSFWKVRGGNARADRFHLPRGVIRCAI